jgi:dephospho-CoA kinase
MIAGNAVDGLSHSSSDEKKPRNRAMRVGVTGGIGSGKSTVCQLFADLGVPVYNSDARARELMNGDGGIKRAIVTLLGPGAYRDERLDSAYVAARVFTDKVLLASLNAIVHPAVALDFEAWALSFADQPYVVLESAILFESGFDRFVDRVIAVSASPEVRLTRVLLRGGGGRDASSLSRSGDVDGVGVPGGQPLSREEVMRRMANQLPDVDRETRSWRTIDNNGTLAQLIAHVQQLDNQLKQ